MLGRSLKFDWDLWNHNKNEIKHGVSQIETESSFTDPNQGVYDDVKHSTEKEKRYVLYGMSVEKRILMVGFTIRHQKIRVITARPASRRERKFYEKEKKS